MRIAGRFCSRHKGYEKDFHTPIDEINHYKRTARFSYSRGLLDETGEPFINISVLEYTQLVEKVESLDRLLFNVTQQRDNFLEELEKVYLSNSWRIMAIFRSIRRLLQNGE